MRLTVDIARRALAAITAALLVRSATAQLPQNQTIFNTSADASLYLWQTGNAAPTTPFAVAASGSNATDNQPKPQFADRYNMTGVLMLVGTENYTRLSPTPQNGTIAYISCDQSDYDNGFIRLTDVVTSVNATLGVGSLDPNVNHGAILLYSRSSRWCSLDMTMSFQNIFTMTSASDSVQLYNSLTNGSYVNQFSWIANKRNIVFNSTYGPDGAATVNPTTTIAMIVLYSVTGIITFLFLLIIILGAVRAHRHPERYGPRNILGLPRQSRARGMARAVLDTIPIIKFGETEQTKPADGAHDVELGERDAEHARDQDAAGEGTDTTANAQRGGENDTSDVGKDAIVHTVPASDLTDTPADVPGADTVHVEPGVTDAASPEDDSVQCPICTEDFVRGEPARHLPCNHNFHPACIDPWLLNVSSTCPLCRVDLNPPGESEAVTQSEQLDEAQSRSRVRRSFIREWGVSDLRNLGTATREERIEALRQVREERAAREGNDGDRSRRGRFGRLFRSNRQSQAMTETEFPAAAAASSENINQQPDHQPPSQSNRPISNSA